MTTFENVGRRRLTAKGSRAAKELELEVPDLKPGEGRILPSGEIALNDPKAGLIVLRADHVHTYIPKKAAANPLDKLVSDAPDDETDNETDNGGEGETTPESKDAPEKADDTIAISAADDAPLITPGGKKTHLSDEALGNVTGGSGIGTSY